VDAWAARPLQWRERAPSPHAGRPDRPLFIGACPRSGTTLLRSLLNNHPDLAMPAETDFVLHLWAHRGRIGDLRDPARRRRLAEWIFDTPGRGGRRIRAGAVSRDEAVARVAAAPPTLGSVLGAVFAIYADATGKPRWGDKRPAYATQLDVVFALFPHAQFVNLVRDPRAAVDSQLRSPWYRDWRTPPTSRAITAWEYSVRRVDRFASGLRPDQLLDVRYEDLVREPAAVLERICAFAGLRGGDAIADMLSRPRTGGLVGDWHARVAEPISTGPIDAWRDRLSPGQVALVEHATRAQLARFGYAPTTDAAPSRLDLGRLRRQRRKREVKWRRYVLGELKRRHVTHRHPVAAE
jgi:hypothetical protein